MHQEGAQHAQEPQAHILQVGAAVPLNEKWMCTGVCVCARLKNMWACSQAHFASCAHCCEEPRAMRSSSHTQRTKCTSCFQTFKCKDETA
eukprot:1146286-Pelagomonas_calceolata.AAC.1